MQEISQIQYVDLKIIRQKIKFLKHYIKSDVLLQITKIPT